MARIGGNGNNWAATTTLPRFPPRSGRRHMPPRYLAVLAHRNTARQSESFRVPRKTESPCCFVLELPVVLEYWERPRGTRITRQGRSRRCEPGEGETRTEIY